MGAPTPQLEQVVHTLEWVRMEEFIGSTWRECGRPEHDRRMLANALVSKAGLGLSTTSGLIERLAVDRALKRICGFPMWKKLPDESTFSRAFAEFAADGLAERTPAALVRETLSEDPAVIRPIVEHLGLWAPRAMQRSPPPGPEPWPVHAGLSLTYRPDKPYPQTSEYSH